LRANPLFSSLSKEFWANVRTISQEVGYTERGKGTIKTPTIQDIKKKYGLLNLSTEHLVSATSELTEMGQKTCAYFSYRAAVLNDTVQHQLMDRAAAQIEFERLRQLLNPKCPLPFNKQKGEKRNHAFLTGMVNMLIESALGGQTCDYDPRGLTTLTQNSQPLRTLSRRVDGAFPSVHDPVAIWEIKEYYYTTTFGSRVADGVYETLLDGMELEELFLATKRKVQHILFVDDHFTWWQCGRSYLCRLIDMLHMGYVSEVVFGREAITRLPILVQEWQAH
jgi:hypothetical protein